MTRSSKRLGIAAGLLVAATSSSAEVVRYRVEALSGTPFNAVTPLEVRQEGFEALRFDASFESRPWKPPIYWAARVSREAARRAWSVELMHHKVYLVERPEEVAAFDVSHGFNMLTIQRAWDLSTVELRAGAGIVIAHPENRVRGRRLDEHRGLFGAGYHLAGAVFAAGAGRRVALSRAAAMAFEVRATVAPVSVPVEGGDARFTNVALHVLAGIGIAR